MLEAPSAPATSLLNTFLGFRLLSHCFTFSFRWRPSQLELDVSLCLSPSVNTLIVRWVSPMFRRYERTLMTLSYLSPARAGGQGGPVGEGGDHHRHGEDDGE